MKFKTIVLSLFAVAILSLSSFRQQITASIVGSWTQTGFEQIVKHKGSSALDTIVRHPAGYAVAFTIDSQYHFTGPYNHKADGTYIINADTLSEFEPRSRSTEQFRIISLTDHALVLRSIGSGIQSGIAIETTTTYAR
jgi:hypothetical protein